MAKLRKMLGSVDSAESVMLMKLIETQSKETIANWSVTYAQENWLPIYEKCKPEDERLKDAIIAARDYLKGSLKLAEAKKVLKEGQVAAREAAEHPVAQVAARAVATATSTITTPTSSLGMAFYGAAAVAYDSIGLHETTAVYDKVAAAEFKKLYIALNDVAIKEETNPAKINWSC